MSTSAVSLVRARTTAWQRLLDYVELAKPKIVVLELVVVAVAAMLSEGSSLQPWVLLHALIGTALVAAGASAWNQWIERRADACMERTRLRPLPSGRLHARQVIASASVLTAAGLAWLWLGAGGLTALVGLCTWLLYVAAYTPLKSRSSLNTLVGAVAGAMPVWIGWSAAGGTLNPTIVTLFLVVFFWQFPHFMAIAWIYRRQYAQAGMKMISVVDPTGRLAGVHAFVAAAIVVPLSSLPSLAQQAEWVYFAGALVLGLAQLLCAVLFWRRPDENSSRLLLRASLVYLPAWLAWLSLFSVA